MTSYIKKLPAVFQTVTEKKFFDATFDQVFSKKDSDLLYGYIGQRIPGLYNPVTDFYLPEPSKDRTWWQLEATAFAQNADSTKSNVFFYDDLLNRINYYGGNTLNQDRLFESNFYSWAPPIDFDMFINYQNYYWVDQGLAAIQVDGLTDDDITAIIGQTSYTITKLGATPQGLGLSTGLTLQFVGSVLYPTPVVVENLGGCDGIRLVPHYPDYTSGTILEFLPWDGAIQLANGRVIRNTNWDMLTWDIEAEPGNGDYITIERGAIDENAWSRTNKWFHIDVINTTVTATGSPFPSNASRALRPIIQFSADLILYKSGTQFKDDIAFGFRGNIYGIPLLLSQFQEQLRSYIDAQLNVELQDGKLVMFMEDPAVKDVVLKVVIDASSCIVAFIPYGTPAVEGDIVFATDTAPFTGVARGQTWYYENNAWKVAVNDKVENNQPPLFQLFDHAGIPLDDTSKYPGSTFVGSKIFSYKINTSAGATADPVLKFPIVYNSLGQSTDIIFQNNLITDRYTYGNSELPIDGYYYYKTSDTPILYNNWNIYTPGICTNAVPPQVSKQRVIDKYVVQDNGAYQYKLSVTPPAWNTPSADDVIVSVNGKELVANVDYWFINISNQPYIDLQEYLANLFTTTQPVAPVVEILTFTLGELDPSAAGYYEIPQQIEANPNQLEIDSISASDLIQQFSSIIENQNNFTGTSFGGSNNYRDSGKNRSVGSYILQNVAPALKTMLISSSDDLDFISGIRFSQDEYTKFKNKYLRTAQQLINQEFNPLQYHNNTIIISAWVDEIIKVVNVSKEFSNAFAYSYMIANGAPYLSETAVVSVDGVVALSNYLDLSADSNALYVYDTTSQENLLLIGVDYEIVSTNLSIEIQFKSAYVGENVYVALYKNPLPAYIPSTPTKLGMYNTFVPRIEMDMSYTIPTNVIIGHDGSKTIAYGDYRDQLLLELEKRIYNLLQYKFRNEYYLPLRVEDVKSGYFRQTRYSRDEYIAITESYLNKWSAKNRANYRANDWESASAALPNNSPELWKLYNYSTALGSFGFSPTRTHLNLPGNWKGIFQFFYDTIFPNTRPWEMLGFSSMPTWWISQYGSNWSSTNTALWTDLESGMIRQGPSAIFDPITLLPQQQEKWARPGLSHIIPVDAIGNIVPVTTLFNIEVSGNLYAPFTGYDNPWVYGDGGPVEQAWMSTSSYAFSVQEFLYLMKPGLFGELFFDTVGTELSPGALTLSGVNGAVRSSINWQYVQNDTYSSTDPLFAWMRPKNKYQVVHAEIVDSVIQIRYGYQRWISDKILFLGSDVSTVFGQKVRTLGVNLANKLAGFTNKDTVSTYIESVSTAAQTTSLLVPSNNFSVLLHKGQPIHTYVYSGVVVRALADGTFVVYGYDLLNSIFTVLDRSNAQAIDITIGGTPADYKTFERGETYNEGDIIRYNGIYYQSTGTFTAGKFDSSNWQKLKALPTVGGISVVYKPVSEVTYTTVPYGTVLKTPQAVFDLLIGWGAYLETQGWEFTDVSADTNQVSDWLYSAKQYLFWLNTNWAADASIQLSPAANNVMLTVKNGYPDDVESISNGVYSILDKFGVAMPPNSTTADRDGMSIAVAPVDLSVGGIYFLQVHASETEHVLIFDNTTSFGDVVYDPLLRDRQQRLRFNGFRSNGWYGKKEAPGYLIMDNQLVPNYDTIVDSMRYFYDPDVTIDNPSLEALGRHLIGYESKSYLDNLQLSNDIQYLFYQGAMRQKGTIQALDKLFRSTKVQHDEIIEVYEEWALKLSDFGNTVEQVSTEFILQPEQNSGEVIVARLNFVPSAIGSVKEIRVVNAENIYTKVPRLVVSAPDADLLDPALTQPLRIAKAYVVLDSTGRISRVDITDPGYGYLVAPSVSIDTGASPNQRDSFYAVWQGEIIKDTLLDNIIDIDIDDTATWTVRPVNPSYSLVFPTTPIIDYSMPTAGYVNFDDVKWSTFDITQTHTTWGSSVLNPTENDTIWVAKTFTEDWDVYKLVNVVPGSGTAIPWKLTKDDAGNLLLLTSHSVDSTLAVVPQPSAYVTSSLVNGFVSSIRVTEGGSGYVTAPTVVITGDGTGAVATAIISGGSVTNVVITNGGNGYTTSPAITFTTTTTGVISATATASMLASVYIDSTHIVRSGGFFATAPSVSISGPTTDTATFTSVVTNGQLTGIAVTHPGAGYSVPPSVFISDAMTVIPAVLTPIIDPITGGISSVTVVSGGQGYTSNATIIATRAVTSDGDVNAVFSITVGTTGNILSVAVVTPGTGYQNTPGKLIVPQLSTSPGYQTDFGNVIALQNNTGNTLVSNHIVQIQPSIGSSITNPWGEPATYTDPTTLDTYYSYDLLAEDGTPLTENTFGDYASITDLLLFKTMRFRVVAGIATIVAGSIADIQITNSGSGYIVPPTVTIIGDGMGATANATLTNGSVTGIAISAPGSGYTNATVHFTLPMPAYVATDDKVWFDNIGNLWSVQTYANSAYTPYRIQEPLIDTKLFENAQVFQFKTQTELVLLPVYDPFKSILPAPVKQNITYMVSQDPARYNVSADPRLFSENITFGEAQVGKLWWDLSAVRFTYYEQPRAVNETTLHNLVYRRDNWGSTFPGSTFNMYEWTSSPVPPASYTGTGTPKSTTDYVQITTTNRFTNITVTTYYFWVLNPTTKPNIENRTLAALDVSNLMATPKSQGFTFFSPIQQTTTYNSYMFYNVQEILSYQGNNVQIQYRIADRNDQKHAQWKFFREGDTASIVTDQYWNKMVDSLTGYTKILPDTGEWSEGIIVADNLPWDIYGWDVSPYDDATETSTPSYGEVLPVPDPALGESEKYGITYRPRQGMFADLYAARKIFVQSANNLLKYIPIRDNTAGWDSGVTTDAYWSYTTWYAEGFENAIPTAVYATLADAQTALTAGKLNTGTIIEVINGTADNRFVLYAVVQVDPANVTQSFETIAIEASAINLLDTIYTTKNVYALSVELRQLLDAFRAEVMINGFVVDQNELYFSLLNYVYSEQKNPDWTFKTSYIYIKENNIPLTQSKLYMPDQIDNIIGYINDVKPYHTQVRDYTSTHITSDLATGTASDAFSGKTILQFGPDYGGPYENGNWDADCNDPATPLAWDSQSWDVCPDNISYIIDPVIGTWDSVVWDILHWDITGVAEQFLSDENIVKVDITSFDSSKIGYSELFPYTFSFDGLNLNNPQTFITPTNVISIAVDGNIQMYGKDYYVEYNNLSSDYTVYFYKDPGTSTTKTAYVLWDGGDIIRFRYNTNRTEIAYGIPSDTFVINVDTKLPAKRVAGVLHPYAPTSDSTVISHIVAAGGVSTYSAAAGATEYLPVTMSYKQQVDVSNNVYIRNANAWAGTLITDLPAPQLTASTHADVITVFVDPSNHTITTNIFPEPSTALPGKVWINGEKIEYRAKTQIAANTWQLSLLRRGSDQTAPAPHLSSSDVWVEQENIMQGTPDIDVWNATAQTPNLTTEVLPNEFTSISAVAAGGIWYATTPEAMYLKDSLGKAIL